MKPKPFVNLNLNLQLLVAIIVMLLFACNKSIFDADSSRKRHQFTTLSENADSRIQRYADSLLKQESAKPFMDIVMKTIGTPGWGLASFGLQRGEPAAMVPLINSTVKKVTGLLVMVEGVDGFRFRIIDSRTPEKYGFSNRSGYANARSIFFAADLFNQRAFPDEQPAGLTDPCMMTKSERKYLESARRSSSGAQFTLRAMPYAISITCYTTVACTGDGNGNCVKNIVTSTDCIYNYIWIDDWSDFPSGGNNSSYGGGGGNGGGSGSSSHNQQPPSPCGAQVNNPNGGPLAILPPAKPINDVKQYVSCFDVGESAKLTFFADQPQPGSDEPFTVKGKVGHSFISIEQLVGGRIIRRTVGFHPFEAVSPFFAKQTEGQLGDDSGEAYDVRLDVNISGDMLGKVIYLIENHNPIYHLEEYNCTNFVLDISESCGLKIPRNKSSWIFGNGFNPGQFGEDLKNMPGAKVGKGYSEKNVGDCK